jgi:hypothetical protein
MHLDIEQIDKRRNQSTHGKSTAITHKNLGGIDIISQKCNQCRHDDTNHCRSQISLIPKRYSAQYRQNDQQQPPGESIQSIGNIDSVDKRDSKKETQWNHQSSQVEQIRHSPAKQWPQMDSMYTHPDSKEDTNSKRDDKHNHQFDSSRQAFDSSDTFDIKNIIHQTQNTHTKKSSQENKGLFLRNERKPRKS